MRSPGNWRAAGERVLRAASLAAMAALATRLWLGGGQALEPRVSTTSLDSALLAWSATPPARVSVDALTIPGGRQRDWLVALRLTGTAVDWTSSDSVGGVLVVERGPLPQSASRITALGAPGAGDVTLADELGLLDSSRVGGDRIVRWRATPIGPARAMFPGSIAIAAARDSLLIRPVLVVGQAGWESRFVITALEEDGWPVSARLTVAPGAVVRQHSPARIDTATLSAVIVLDSTSLLDSGEIARFVHDGGGLVASGAGVNHADLRQLVPSRVTAGSAGAVGALLGPDPRQGLFVRTFTTSAGAVPLERRGASPVVIGRRVGSGKVTAVGYDETWRLRMTPPDERAPDAHRVWWSSLVAGVALARLTPNDAGHVDEAPLAATVDALGLPGRAGDRPDRVPAWPTDAFLAALVATFLLAEWLSRRLRGVA